MNTTSYFPPARLNPGRAYFVAPLDADHSGLSWNVARNTIQAAVDLAQSGDYIYVAPGTYVETVTIPVGTSVSIIGIGPFGTISIAPSTAHAGAMINHADNCIFENLTFTSPDTTSSTAFTNTGSHVRVYSCRFQGAAKQILTGPGLNALVTATPATAGKGLDTIFEQCEITNGTEGVYLQGTDYGPAAQVIFRNCLFNRLTTSSFEESNSSGSASNQFRNLLVQDCSFEPAQDGTEPTKYFALDDSNSNTGLATGNRFTVSLTSGKNLVSTKLSWTGNWHPSGASTGQPS